MTSINALSPVKSRRTALRQLCNIDIKGGITMKKIIGLLVTMCILGGSVCSCGSEGGTGNINGRKAGYSESDADFGSDSFRNSGKKNRVEEELYNIRSNITSADSAASSVQKAFESTLTDADAKGIKLTYDGWVRFDDGVMSADITLTSGNANEILGPGVFNYFEKFDEMTGAAYIKNSSCTAVVLTNDGEFVGTYPSGYVTEDDFVSGGEFEDEEIYGRLGIAVQRVVDDAYSSVNEDGIEVSTNNQPRW